VERAGRKRVKEKEVMIAEKGRMSNRVGEEKGK
jgi:hypothetical protein